MSIVQIMVTIIIVTILITVILGVASYGAYWLRRSRRPVETEESEAKPRFFYRYVPDGGGVQAEVAASTETAERVEVKRAEPRADVSEFALGVTSGKAVKAGV
jgi:Tfp pilus assembly protein PilE